MDISALLLGLFETPTTKFERLGKWVDCGDVRIKPVIYDDSAHLSIRWNHHNYRIDIPVYFDPDFELRNRADAICLDVYHDNVSGGDPIMGVSFGFMLKWRPIIYGLLWCISECRDPEHNLPEELINIIKVEYFEGRLRS